MNCLHCMEEINDAASVCPYCRRSTPREISRKQKRRIVWAVVLGVPAGLLLIIGLAALIPNRDDQCRRATALNPTVTPQQCLDMVEKYGDVALTMIAPMMRH